mmetsp:Transcript_984/g.3492  ORF Transcript_984/g.3492 Transcript_984/m.3492 type:complete len:237 (+) Transcript_984:154-864(+)
MLFVRSPTALVPKGLTRVRERSAEGPQLIQEADEQVKLTVAHVRISFDGALVSPTDDGCLYVTTRRVVWHSLASTEVGYAISFRSIGMHAVSRDTSSFPQACVYLQIDGEEPTNDDGSDEDDTAEGETKMNEEQALASVEEVRLVPAEEAQLDEIFQAMCDCAALNPDDEGDTDDDDAVLAGEADEDMEEGEMLTTEEAVIGGPGGAERAAMLDRFDRLLQSPDQDDGRFDDAEEE